jgi:16S rRNA processing protein RimM
MPILTQTFTIAVAGSPFGLKGFLKVRSLSGEIAHLATLKNVCLRQGDSEKIFSIEEIVPCGTDASGGGEFLLVKFLGIDSPEAAAGLKGARFVVDRSQAAPLKNGEFYVEDLKGLEVIAVNPESSENTSSNTGNAKILGHITDILEGGGGDLVEFRLLSGEIRLVPFRKEFFGDISLENGSIVLLEQWILE